MAHTITWGNAKTDWYDSRSGGGNYNQKAGTLKQKDFDLSNGIVAIKVMGSKDGNENFIGGGIIHNLQPPDPAVQNFLEAHDAMTIFEVLAHNNAAKQRSAGYNNAQIIFKGLNTWQTDGRSLKQAFEAKGVKVFVCQLVVAAKPELMVSGTKVVVRQHVWLEFVDKATNPDYEPAEIHKGPGNCCVLQSGFVCSIM